MTKLEEIKYLEKNLGQLDLMDSLHAYNQINRYAEDIIAGPSNATLLTVFYFSAVLGAIFGKAIGVDQYFFIDSFDHIWFGTMGALLVTKIIFDMRKADYALKVQQKVFNNI